MSDVAPAAGNSRGLAAYVAVYLVFLYLPIALIPLFSFNNAIQAAFPLKGFTVDWYWTLLDNPAPPVQDTVAFSTCP